MQRHLHTYSSIGNIATSSLGNYLYAGTNYANPHAPTSIGGLSLNYDNNGNVTAYGTSTYTWDYRNRITQAGAGTATSTYGYDYAGNRVSVTTAGVTTKYASEVYNSPHPT
jgi:YD repeat-containing protein